MSDNLKIETCERLFNILSKGVPMLFEAANYVEKANRIIPNPAIIESRDVLSHIRDIALNSLDKENVNKNLVEIEQHIRRGIVETYQEHYEHLASNIFQTYGKYKQSFIRFESLLRLRAKHAPLHKNINQILKSAQNAWMEARNLKNNDLDSPKLKMSIDKFKEASSLLSSIGEDVDAIFNDFYSRGIVTSFIFLFSLSLFVILLVKFFAL